LSRPPIATSRTDHYDGVNVTFHYKRHEDDSLVTETVTASEFIKRLVVHVPPRYFNMVRYYGLYAKSKIHLNKIGNILTAKRYSHCFRSLLMKTLGIDPHRCSVCGQNLIFAWLTHTPFNKISFYNSRSPPLTSWSVLGFYFSQQISRVGRCAKKSIPPEKPESARLHYCYNFIKHLTFEKSPNNRREQHFRLLYLIKRRFF